MVVLTRELMVAKMECAARVGKSRRAVATGISGEPLAGDEWDRLALVLALFLRFEFAIPKLRACQHVRRSHGIAAAAQQTDEPAHQQRSNQDQRHD
jgi:hypothetical protein